ncbi:uncharacterized protein LOC142577775 [Dermacentor variabilis]|uniref:uncharacterized protein LOC142577775 n=1 Tax=Dermacentor variabilis TaxID=34621 RepID=UPI003F5B810B
MEETLYRLRISAQVPNESLRLRCGIVAPDGENLTWFKDGEELFPDNDRFLAVGRTLEIRRASEDDAGAYGCSRALSAVNDSAGMAHVLQLVTPVRLEPLEGAVYAPLGARVNLECRAYARPDPQVTWLFGDRSRVSSPLLSVDNVSVSHSGTYRCSASHERCARLVAESDVTVNVFESTIRTNEGFPGSGITLTPGADFLRLTCDYPADRSAKIVWMKGNATVRSGDKYVYKDQSLVINKPERSDVGNYSCVALGRVVNETAVIVVGLKVEIRTSQSKRFKEGHDGFLSCKIDGYPRPTIRWYRNGHLLNAFRSSKFKYGGNGADDYGTLVIRRLGKRDEATFACLVDNGHSQDRAFFAVVVSVPPSPLVPFFVICAEVALLTAVAFLFEQRVRSLWMAARRTTSPKRLRSPDRAAGHKQKSCTESDILRFISCLESSGDLNLDDLHAPQPDEKPQAKDVDAALKDKPPKSALLSRGKIDAAAEPHVEFRPSENVVKADIEPLNELEALNNALTEGKEGRTQEKGPTEDNVSRRKSRKKKSRRSSRRSRLSEDEPFPVTAEEDSTQQAAELEKPLVTAQKERAPKFSRVAEEPLPTVAQSKVSMVDKIPPWTVQEEEEVPQFSEMKADVLPTTSQGKEQVPQFASVEKRVFPLTAQKFGTVPQFSEAPTAELPQRRYMKAKMDQGSQELPAEVAISRAKAKNKRMPKKPFAVPPMEESEDAGLRRSLQKTEEATFLAKGSVFSQGKDAKEKATACELAAETCSISSLDDFTYRKDSASSQIGGSEVLTDTIEYKPAVRKADSDGTGSFLFEEEPCNWKHPERQLNEYPETQAVAVAGDVPPSGHEGALSGMPAAEGDAFARGIGFTQDTKHDDGSLRTLKRKGKRRKGGRKSKNAGGFSPEAPEEGPFFFGAYAGAGMKQNILRVPLFQQRDEAKKAGFVGYAEDTMVEGWLKCETKPPGDAKRGSLTRREEMGGYPSVAQGPLFPTQESVPSHPDLEAVRALPIQEPIPFPTALEGKLVPCMSEAEPTFSDLRQIKHIVKKRESKNFLIEPEINFDIESPPAPPSPEEVSVRSRRESCVEPPVVTRVPFPSRHKSDRPSVTHSSLHMVKAHKAGERQKADAQVVSQSKRDKVPAKASTVLSTPDRTKPILHQGTPPKSSEVEGLTPEKEPRKDETHEARERVASRMPPILFSRISSQQNDEPVLAVSPSASTPDKSKPTHVKAMAPKSTVAERMVLEKKPREKLASVSASSMAPAKLRRTSGQKVELVQREVPEILSPLVEMSEGAPTGSARTERIVATPPRETLSRRTSGKKVEPVRKKVPEIPRPLADVSEGALTEGAPTDIIAVSPLRENLSRRTSGQNVEPVQKVPEIPRPVVDVSEDTLTRCAPTNRIVATPPRETLSRRNGDQRGEKGATTTPVKMGPLVPSPESVVCDSTLAESTTTSEGTVPSGMGPWALQEAYPRRTTEDRGDTVKSTTLEKACHLVQVQDSTLSERPISEITVSESAVAEGTAPMVVQGTLPQRFSQEELVSAARGTAHALERRGSEDSSEDTESDITAVIKKRKQGKKLGQSPAPKDHVVSDVTRPESVTSVHPRVPTDERSPTRTSREMLDHQPGMINGMLGDTTVPETLSTSVEPESSADSEDGRLVEVEARPFVSKRQSTSTDDEQDTTEEQITLYEGLQVPSYQTTPSSSEGEYEPPMVSDLFNSTASPELDWTQNPDNYYFLSIPPFEFAIPSSQIDGPEAGSPPGTASKQLVRDEKRKRGSPRKRRKPHRYKKHTQSSKSTSGTFTPSSEPEVDSPGQSTADRSGQPSTDRSGQANLDRAAPSTSHESSQREDETASPNRRVKRNK